MVTLTGMIDSQFWWNLVVSQDIVIMIQFCDYKEKSFDDKVSSMVWVTLKWIKLPQPIVLGPVLVKGGCWINLGQNFKILFFWWRVIFRVWLITCQKIITLRVQEPPKMGGKGGGVGNKSIMIMSIL